MATPSQQHPHTPDQALGVKPIEAGLWAVSSSRPGTPPYLVREKGDGSYTCDCPDFTFRQAESGGTCKHILMVHPAYFPCPNCGERNSAHEGAWCACCDAQFTAWNEHHPEYAPLVKEEDIPVEQTPIYREAMAAVRSGEDAMSAAARNARSVANHRFAEGSKTLLAGTRPSPLESAGYGR